MANYFRPVKIRGHFGAVLFDERGDEINEDERGLNEPCIENTHIPPSEQDRSKKHDWLLLPKQEGQKQYLYCLKCGKTSHL